MQKQTVHLPLISQVNEGIIHQVDQILSHNNFSFNNILVVSGNSRSKHYAEQILSTINASGYVVAHNNPHNIQNLVDRCLTKNIDLIIAVGGGFVLDIVKRVSLITDIENILVPSIISNDGLISPIAVITDEDGKTHSMPGKMPVGIIVDIAIIQEAPIKFLQAAAGDILSNISATNDWVLSSQNTGEKINDLAYMLSRSAAYSLLHHEAKDLRNRNFLKQVIYCQINSGLAMALAGTSRPCSGSEHLLSHAIDFKNLSENTLHGLQVGSISVFCLYLQNKLDVKCLNYAYELGIPYAFDSLDSKIYGKLQDIYEMSLTMRPGRFTVLDLMKGQPFEQLYSEFINFLNRFK